MLPLTSDPSDIRQITESLDGFLFTGGHDVSPSVYNAQDNGKCVCCPERDRMEALLFDHVYAADKPAFGICRGIQFINSYTGGTLYQDLPSERPSKVEHHQEPPYDIPVHQVAIIKDTPLYSLLESETLAVNSYHHQAVKDLSPRLSVMAVSEDGLVEAVYAPDKKYIWAVQWHPEFSYESDETSLKIFKAFVESFR